MPSIFANLTKCINDSMAQVAGSRAGSSTNEPPWRCRPFRRVLFPMRNVMIAGIAEPVHGRIPGLTPMALHERLGLQALDDAGLELRDVDAILTLAPRSDSYLIHAAAFAEYLGINPPTALTLEGGGAAPAIMVDMARNMIEGGSAKTVLIVSADMPLSVNTRD